MLGPGDCCTASLWLVPGGRGVYMIPVWIYIVRGDVARRGSKEGGEGQQLSSRTSLSSSSRICMQPVTKSAVSNLLFMYANF